MLYRRGAVQDSGLLPSSILGLYWSFVVKH